MAQQLHSIVSATLPSAEPLCLIRMKYTLFLLLTISMTSCKSDCNCNNDQLSYFVSELEGYHMRTPNESDIKCLDCEDLWLVKWTSEKSLMGSRKWDLIIEKSNMLPANSIGVMGTINKEDCGFLSDFIRYTRERNYDISNISIQDTLSIYATIESKNGGLMADQVYVKSEDVWILDTTYHYYSGYDNDVDINNKHNMH